MICIVCLKSDNVSKFKHHKHNCEICTECKKKWILQNNDNTKITSCPCGFELNDIEIFKSGLRKTVSKKFGLNKSLIDTSLKSWYISKISINKFITLKKKILYSTYGLDNIKKNVFYYKLLYCLDIMDSGLIYYNNTFRNKNIQCTYPGCKGILLKKESPCINCKRYICIKCKKNIDYNSYKDHKCNDDDILSENFLKKEMENNKIKPCPICTTPCVIESGCDTVFCLICKNSFNWSTGLLLSTSEHNPDRDRYIKSVVGNSIRTIGDIYSGGSIIIEVERDTIKIPKEWNRYKINLTTDTILPESKINICRAEDYIYGCIKDIINYQINTRIIELYYIPKMRLNCIKHSDRNMTWQYILHSEKKNCEYKVKKYAYKVYIYDFIETLILTELEEYLSSVIKMEKKYIKKNMTDGEIFKLVNKFRWLGYRFNHNMCLISSNYNVIVPMIKILDMSYVPRFAKIIHSKPSIPTIEEYDDVFNVHYRYVYRESEKIYIVFLENVHGSISKIL